MFDEAHGSVFLSEHSAHKNQSQDDPYLQSSTACNRLWSGSPGSQWLCCPQFGASCPLPKWFAVLCHKVCRHEETVICLRKGKGFFLKPIRTLSPDRPFHPLRLVHRRRRRLYSGYTR